MAGRRFPAGPARIIALTGWLLGISGCAVLPDSQRLATPLGEYSYVPAGTMNRLGERGAGFRRRGRRAA